MRTDDLAKRAGKRSQHIIYKTISKSALSLYILGFFLYKGGRAAARVGGARRSGAPPRARDASVRGSSRACALPSLA